MKNITSTSEPVNPCSDESDGKRHVMFASRPYPHFFPRLRKKLLLGILKSGELGSESDGRCRGNLIHEYMSTLNPQGQSSLAGNRGDRARWKGEVRSLRKELQRREQVHTCTCKSVLYLLYVQYMYGT